MKENGKVYVCELCGKNSEAGPGVKIPDCCGQPMQLKLDKCTQPFVAQTARPNAADEPCDDGTDASNK